MYSLLCQSSLRDGGGAESTRYLVVHSQRQHRDADRFLARLDRQCLAWREAADGAESAHAHGRDRKWNIGAAVLTADIWLTCSHIKRLHFCKLLNYWRPHGDSNPGYCRE